MIIMCLACNFENKKTNFTKEFYVEINNKNKKKSRNVDGLGSGVFSENGLGSGVHNQTNILLLFLKKDRFFFKIEK